ncbi:hypothetical protein [Chitinophaga costaii]|nr:hypothetical protein [Chitinophaga costaii]
MKTICLLLFCCLVGCTTTKPSFTDAGLYTVPQEWTATLHDGWFSAKTYSIGNYTTSSRQNGVAKPGLPVTIQHPKDAFYYTISGPTTRLAVQTLYTVQVVFAGRDLPSFLQNAPGDTPFFYALFNDPAQPAARWELVLRSANYLELNKDSPIGILMLDKTIYRITAHNHFGTVNAYEKITYEIQDRGKPLAAVMPGAQPRVWMSKMVTPPQEVLFAGVISALLLRG